MSTMALDSFDAFTPRLARSSNINDFSLPPQHSSATASTSRVTMQMSDDGSITTPAERLRALLQKVSSDSPPAASGSRQSYSYNANESQADSDYGSNYGSSAAQESLRDLFRSMRDTPEKPKAMQRRSSIDLSEVGHSPLKSRVARTSFSDEGVDMDLTAPSFHGTQAQSTPSSRQKSPFATMQTPSQFQMSANSRSNLLDQDSSMQRAMMGDSLSFGEKDALQTSRKKTPRAPSKPQAKEAQTPASTSRTPTNNNLHRSWQRRNRLSESGSSASSGSRSSQHEDDEDDRPLSPDGRPPSRFSTPGATSHRLNTPSTVKQGPIVIDTPSTARPALGPSRSPVLTPSYGTKPLRVKSPLSSSITDEARLRKAVSVPLPSSSPISTPPTSPEVTPAQPVLSPSLRSRTRTPEPASTSQKALSPPTSRLSMPPLSYSSTPARHAEPTRSSTPQESPERKVVRLSPQTPSILTTPGSMRRRSFSPRTRSPSPSFELENSTLPSLPSSSEDEAPEPNQGQAASKQHISIFDSEDDQEMSMELTNIPPESSGTGLSFASARHLGSFAAAEPRSMEEEEDQEDQSVLDSTKDSFSSARTAATKKFTSFTSETRSVADDHTNPESTQDSFTSVRTLAMTPRQPLKEYPPVTPAPPGAFPRTPAPPGAFNTTYRFGGSATPHPTSGETHLPTETPYRNMKTPKPPGAWAATPSIIGGGSSLRKGRFSVRFDETADSFAGSTRPKSKLGIPHFEDPESDEGDAAPEDASTSLLFSPQPKAKEQEEEGKESDGFALETSAEISQADTSLSSTSSKSSSRRMVRHRRTPSVRMVDAFGQEEKDDLSSSASSSPTKPKRRKRPKINMVDSMGREVIEIPTLDDITSEDLGVEDVDDRVWDEMFPPTQPLAIRKHDATKRLRRGLASLANDLDDLDDLDRSSSHDDLENKRLASLIEASEEARWKRKQMENELKQLSKAQPKLLEAPPTRFTPGFSITKRTVGLFILLQVVLFLCMLRYSNIRARALFIKAYYDTFYGDIFLFTSYYRDQIFSTLSTESTPLSTLSDGNSTSISFRLPSFGFPSSIGGVKDGNSFLSGFFDLLGFIVEPLFGRVFGSSGSVDVASWPPM